MSCKRYFNQDECRYYPTDCNNCPGSYFYEILDDEEDIKVDFYEEEEKKDEIYKN